MQVTKLKPDTLGDCPSVDEVKKALEQATYKIVTLTHVRTSPSRGLFPLASLVAKSRP